MCNPLNFVLLYRLLKMTIFVVPKKSTKIRCNGNFRKSLTGHLKGSKIDISIDAFKKIFKLYVMDKESLKVKLFRVVPDLLNCT